MAGALNAWARSARRCGLPLSALLITALPAYAQDHPFQDLAAEISDGTCWIGPLELHGQSVLTHGVHGSLLHSCQDTVVSPLAPPPEFFDPILLQPLVGCGYLTEEGLYYTDRHATAVIVPLGEVEEGLFLYQASLTCRFSEEDFTPFN